MKLVSFNIWGGTIYEPLMEYLKKLSVDTDIFCFQEVFSALPGAPKVSAGARMYLFDELLQSFPDYVGLFEVRSSNYDFAGRVDFPVSHGLAIFIHKKHIILNYNTRFLGSVGDYVDHLIKTQILKLSVQGKKFFIINFHGVALPGDKLDTPQRLDQSAQLAKIWESLGESPKILCGDFNLDPSTESIAILNGCGRNLISEFGIGSTRNQISWNRFPGSKQNFADYTFVSPEIKVKNFEVPYNEVSDHLPMILEFEL